MLLLCIVKNSVRSLIQRTELSFIELPFILNFHSLLRHHCPHLSQPPAFWWLTVQAGGREYPTILILFKGYESLLLSFSSEKRVSQRVLPQYSMGMHLRESREEKAKSLRVPGTEDFTVMLPELRATPRETAAAESLPSSP